MIKRGAVQVEAVTRGDDESDDLAGHAKSLHVEHGLGQGRFRAGRGEGNEGRLLNRPVELPDRHFEEEHHRQEHAAEKDNGAGVKRQDEHAQLDHDPETPAADGDGDGRADADGRIFHDNAGELEHGLGDGLAEVQDDPFLAVDHPQGQGENDGEDDDLQDLALGRGLDDALGEDVHQDVAEFLGLGRQGRDVAAL